LALQVEDWSHSKLAEVADKKIVYGIVQAGAQDDQGVPYIKSSDVGQSIQSLGLSKTALAIHQKYHRSTVHPGDIVFSLRGNTGATSIVPADLPEANLTQGTARIAVSAEFDNRFVRYVLASDIAMRQVLAVAKGSTFTEVSLDALRKITIPHPPLPEQQKIADILSTWDQAIEKTDALLRNARTQKRALMQQLLTGKRRFPEFEGQPWKEVRLGDVVDCLDNKRVPLNSSQRNEMQGDIPYWGANGIVGYVDDYIFDEPLVLLAEDGGYFDEFSTRPIANLSYGKAWVNNHAHILRAGQEVETEWLYYTLVNRNILGFINSGTRSKLNKGDMLKIPVQLPPLSEQVRIAETIGLADRDVTDLEQQITKLRTEKKALMQQLLTGKRRVVA
jgi:type I restriction enzyme S subunit